MATKLPDEMEQWVTDSFYSYFPSLNAEKVKEREINHRRQQLDYQNYTKKISTDGTLNKIKKNRISLPVTSRSDETNYKAKSYSDNDSPRSLDIRPVSTRQRLLQDLKHTELSNMTYGDGIQIRNQENMENEIKKKKKYQEELMRQIEEKRQKIELLRKKDEMEEEALTRKLEEQLRTMDLQEELEKEKQKTEKARFELEQNKIVRKRLLKQLENDRKLQNSASLTSRSSKKLENIDKEIPNKQSNDVYKFFRNSAQREYQNSNNYLKENSFDNLPQIQHKNELKKNSINNKLKDCSHINENVCPFCDMKLKNYDSWCNNCNMPIFDDGAENRLMLCENCETQYLICSACDKEQNICNFCNRKRNICLRCILNFCIHCGNSERNYHKRTLNDDNFINGKSNLGNSDDSERSFQILDLQNSNDEDNSGNYIKKKQNVQNFSINLHKNSRFHPDNFMDNQKYIENLKNNENINVKEIFNDTISNYLKNYGDLPHINNPYQEIKDKSFTLNEMPLLREQPHKNQQQHAKFSKTRIKKNNAMDNLTERWEVPAVEKRTIATNVVLTQLGAVRRQLQMDRLQLNNNKK